jgi:hypothetical protein
MAFLSSIGSVLVAQNKQALAQSFVVDKKTVSAISKFVRSSTEKHWKPLAGAAFVGTCIYGAIKIRSEILLAREELKFQPNTNEVENLKFIANSVDGVRSLDVSDFAELDSLADDLLLELEEEKELEDCLENDPTASEDVRWSSAEKELDIVDLQIKKRRSETKSKSDDEDEVQDDVITSLKMKKVIIAQEAYHKEQYRKQRKRVRSGQLSTAVRGLAAKIRASFPIPDGSMLQQKAMCLYAAKECRKMCIREAQVATMVPKAVSLASIPTTSQVDLRQITKIESVELKYKKMAWSGYKNKQGWASHLASLFA